MKKILFTLATTIGFALAGLAAWLATPAVCYGCTDVIPPPICGVNASAMTIHKGDDRKEWWNFLAPRDERLIHVYLGINHNQGQNPVNYSYTISTTGDWQPYAARGGLTPLTGSGVLGPAGQADANQTIEISIPYQPAQTGDLVLTGTFTSPDGSCTFEPAAVQTKIRLNEQGPTVWAVIPTACPKAGEKPRLTFGLRNPTDQEQTYNVTVSVQNPQGGSASDLFTLNGQQGKTEVDLGQMVLKGGETKSIKIDCETFGYCLTGGENQVKLTVKPVDGSSGFEAVAVSNVTIRDPNAQCPEPKDWWFIMPPAVAGSLAGLVTLFIAPLGCMAAAYALDKSDQVNQQCFVCDNCARLMMPAAIVAAVLFTLASYYF